MQPLQNSKDRGLFGRLCAGEKKLQGKTFYLDNVKPRSTMLLLEAVSLLGGKIESFLHKDVNFVVTGSQETIKEAKSEVTKGGAKGTSEGTQQQPNKQESGLRNDKRRPGTPRTMPCGSRGKALLEKAICNKERLQRNNMLANAQSWGVKILYVDDVLLYLKHLTRESFSIKHKKTEKPCAKQCSPAVKAAALRSPYLKIEDVSRKYKPLHMQSMTFPALYYSGRFSPFESPPPPRFDKPMDLEDDNKREKNAENRFQDDSQTPLSCNPSPWRPCKKNLSYCECCYQSFSNLDEHLQSDQHRSFVLEASNYTAVDQLVTEMLPGFDPDPSQQPTERPPTPLPIHDVCELEPLTDVETEHAVQILLIEDSSHVSDSPQSPISSRPASPSQKVHFTTPDPATVPADLQPSNPDNHKSNQSQFHTLSPLMPVLTLENFEHQPETLSSCSDAPCLLSDPYSLPPVLSPQVPYYLNIMNHQRPYPEPPILSPQKYTTEESFEGRACEMNFTDSSVSLSTLLQISGTTAEEKREPNSEVPVGDTGGVCSRRGLECVSQSSCSCYSLPQLPTVGPNSKKRCRSASLEHRNLKRRRAMIFRGSGSQCDASKPPNENISEVEDSLCDNASDQMVQSSPNSGITALSTSRFVNVSDLKPPCSTFSFPTVQNFTPTPNQISPVPRLEGDRPQNATSNQCLQSHSVSVCIEPTLIPDLTTLSSALSDSEWDCNLVSRLGTTSATSLTTTEQNCELDKELLHRSCPWMHDTSYESHLHTVLQPSAPATSLCGEDADSSPFSRTLVQIVEVQH